MEFLQVFPQHFSCRESKSDFWTIYSRDRAVIQHLRIQNFGVLKTSKNLNLEEKRYPTKKQLNQTTNGYQTALNLNPAMKPG